MKHLKPYLICEKTIGSENIRTLHYEDIPKDIFYKIINTDPTSIRKKDFSKPGKYSKWLILQYRKKRLTIDLLNNNDYTEKLKYFLFIFSTGWWNKKVTNKMRTILYDPSGQGKIVDSVKDIQKYELSEFYDMVSKNVKDYEIETEKSKYDIVYTDDKIDILIPINFAASYQTAKNTDWCSQTEYGFSSWNGVAVLFRIIPKNKSFDKLKLTWETKQRDPTPNWYIACSRYPELIGQGDPFELNSSGVENWKSKIEKNDIEMSNSTYRSDQKWAQNSIEIKKTMDLLSDEAKHQIQSCYKSHVEKRQVRTSESLNEEIDISTNNMIDSITPQQYDAFMDKWGSEKFSEFEKKKIEDILKIWDDRKGVEYKWCPGKWEGSNSFNMRYTPDVGGSNKLHIDFGGRYFGSEIEIEKCGDGWFAINVIPRDAHTFAKRNHRTYESYRKFYVCDQFDGLLSFLKQINGKYTSIKDDSLFKESLETTNEYYEKITGQEYVRDHRYDGNTYYIISKIRSILGPVKYTSINSERDMISFNAGDKILEIRIDKDEWFKVKFKSPSKHEYLYFKCDQFEGLVRLFKDLGLDIKLSEGVNEDILHDNSYYENIPREEYSKWPTNNENSHVILSKIKNTLPTSVRYTSHGDNSVSFERRKGFGMYRSQSTFEIKFDEDEWFRVKFIKVRDMTSQGYVSYFRCDQFEGLTKLLKDLGLDDL